MALAFLGGRVLFKATLAASERYNTRIEGDLVARLGVRFADRTGAPEGKRWCARSSVLTLP